MANVKDPAWNYFESLNVSRGNEEVKRRFCGKLYKSAKEDRLVDHLLRQCPAVSNEAKTAAGHPDTTTTLPQLVAQVEGDQDRDDSSDDESEIGDDAEDTSDDEQEYMSVEEQEARKCGEITYCLPAFPDIDVTELNEQDEQPVPDRTLTEEDILQMDVDINDDVGVFSNDGPDAVWWQEIETELFDENPEIPSTSTAPAKAAPSTASFSSEENSHGKPWIEAIEQSRYTDFVSKHHACTKQCHAILTQEQLMGRRKSIRSLGYHARSVFLVSQVMKAERQIPFFLRSTNLL
ncbi:hypothetical protein RvY_11459 [Ramazzottius varieornatus]|uniref:BED-type domain-containing protein n=1 Tax=Ramazzottius varieornatus TaxID=947166 RepID=A0A1D1VIK8_RAMVA|nr:hypothetical protein RvY_11459 [Ramazzottius varieornatus]